MWLRWITRASFKSPVTSATRITTRPTEIITTRMIPVTLMASRITATLKKIGKKLLDHSLGLPNWVSLLGEHIWSNCQTWKIPLVLKILRWSLYERFCSGQMSKFQKRITVEKSRSSHWNSTKIQKLSKNESSIFLFCEILSTFNFIFKLPHNDINCDWLILFSSEYCVALYLKKFEIFKCKSL